MARFARLVTVVAIVRCMFRARDPGGKVERNSEIGAMATNLEAFSEI